MSETRASISLHHKENNAALQYLFDKWDDAEKVYKRLTQGCGAIEFQHLTGKSTVNIEHYCEISLNLWSKNMELVSFMVAGEEEAKVLGVLEAQRRTQHKARFANPPAR